MPIHQQAKNQVRRNERKYKSNKIEISKSLSVRHCLNNSFTIRRECNTDSLFPSPECRLPRRSDDGESQYKYASIPALDAKDGRLSMLIFLPYNEGIKSLHTLSRDLSYTPISVIPGTRLETELLLAMPRFNVESKQDLRPALENMGIKDLFDLSANFRVSCRDLLHTSAAFFTMRRSRSMRLERLRLRSQVSPSSC